MRPATDEELLDRIAFVAALDVPAGAVIVAKSSRRLTTEQAIRVQELIVEQLPGRKVLVLPPEIDLDVMRPEGEDE